MSGENFLGELKDTGNDVNALQKLADKYQKQYEETSTKIDELEDNSEVSDKQMNFLRKQLMNQKIKRDVTDIKSRLAADDIDAIFSKRTHLENKHGTILILGLKNSGKTTMMETLIKNKFDAYSSSSSCDFEELLMGQIKFLVIDTDHKGDVWKDYLAITDAIIFLIDSTETMRFDEAKETINVLLNGSQILNKPVAIVATKKDLLTDIDEQDVDEVLDISSKKVVDGLNNVKAYLSNMKDMSSFGCVMRYIATFLEEK